MSGLSASASNQPVTPSECGVCFELYSKNTEPRIFKNCGHTYCYPCITGATEKTASAANPLLCFSCKQSTEITDVASILTHTVVNFAVNSGASQPASSSTAFVPDLDVLNFKAQYETLAHEKGVKPVKLDLSEYTREEALESYTSLIETLNRGHRNMASILPSAFASTPKPAQPPCSSKDPTPSTEMYPNIIQELECFRPNDFKRNFDLSFDNPKDVTYLMDKCQRSPQELIDNTNVCIMQLNKLTAPPGNHARFARKNGLYEYECQSTIRATTYQEIRVKREFICEIQLNLFLVERSNLPDDKKRQLFMQLLDSYRLFAMNIRSTQISKAFEKFKVYEGDQVLQLLKQLDIRFNGVFSWSLSNSSKPSSSAISLHPEFSVLNLNKPENQAKRPATGTFVVAPQTPAEVQFLVRRMSNFSIESRMRAIDEFLVRRSASVNTYFREQYKISASEAEGAHLKNKARLTPEQLAAKTVELVESLDGNIRALAPFIHIVYNMDTSVPQEGFFSWFGSFTGFSVERPDYEPITMSNGNFGTLKYNFDKVMGEIKLNIEMLEMLENAGGLGILRERVLAIVMQWDDEVFNRFETNLLRSNEAISDRARAVEVFINSLKAFREHLAFKLTS